MASPRFLRTADRTTEPPGYRGIGEFHVCGADAGRIEVRRIVALAVERNLWLHAHCDDAALEILFGHDPRVKIIWAHRGFTPPPDKIARYMERYPGLVGELSLPARHYRSRQDHAGLAGAFPRVPRPIRCRLGYVGQQPVGSVCRDHRAIPVLATPAAARGRGEDCVGNWGAAVHRHARPMIAPAQFPCGTAPRRQ